MNRWIPVVLAAAAFCVACSSQALAAEDVVTVSGTVTANGKPAAAVKLTVSYHSDRVAGSFGMMEREEAGATSDTRGRFTLSLPATASSLSYRIETPPGSPLRLADFRSTVDDLMGIAEAAGPVRMDVEMKAGDQMLSGVVTDADGKPVKGAAVTITWGEGASPTGRGASQSLEATTDARGVYRFEHLLPGSFRIDSVVPPRGSGLVPLPRTWRGQGGVRVPSKEATEKNFQLVVGASVRGRVIDENGKPVAGARVSVGLAPATIEGPAVYLRSGNFSDATTTDDRGRYALEGLTPETYQVSAASPDDADFAPAQPVTGLRCEAGKTLDADDIVLVKGGVLKGRVTGADGKPVADATVYYGPRKTGTDAAGRYHFDRLATGVDSLRVFPPEGSIWAARTLEMVPCLSKVSLLKDCTLEKGGSIQGVVTAENGGPIPGARVYASFSSYRYAATTDKDGRYRLVGLVPNTGVDYRGRPQLYGLGVSTPADSPYLGVGEQLNVKAGEEVGRDVILALGATIRGKVTDAAGKPVPDARIEVYKEVGRGGRSYYGTAGPGPGRGLCTAADGTFVVRKLPTDTLDVSASPPEHANLLVAERRGVRCRSGETTDVNLTLKAGGEVKGTVSDPAGKPILGAQVTLSSRTGGQRTGWGRQIRPVDTDAKGAFRFAGLPAGSYEVAVALFDGENVVTGESVEVETGAKVEVKLRAVKGGFIEVSVRDPDGKPVENGNARASSETPGRQSVYGALRSGRAVIGPLLPDTYTVQVTAYTVGERTFTPETIAGVTVKSGERVKRDVELKEGPKRERPRGPTRGGPPGRGIEG